MSDAKTGSAPRILEIGHIPYLYEAFPETTQFYSTWPDEQRSDPARGRHIVSLGTLPGLSRRLAGSDFDLIAVHAFQYPPWSPRALGRTLFRRSALRGSLPVLRGLGQQLLRGRVGAPVAVLDFEDTAVVDRSNAFLMDKAAVYFKRELPQDHWQVFSGTMHWRVPTGRFREDARNRERVAKLEPLSLGAPFGTLELAAALPVPTEEKTIDVFFAGRVHGSSTVRESGLRELLALNADGYVIDIPEAPISHEEFLARCARSWLVWSPSGYGWQCFRTYEAGLCGAVPLANRPTIEQHRPLIDGEYALYYDIEPGGLSHAVRAALSDRKRLEVIGEAARSHVIAYHTPPAIARYIVESTLRKVRELGPHGCVANIEPSR